MKVGFIVESAPKGAECKVIPYLATRVRAEIVPDVITLDEKPILKRECGDVAKALLARGCERVMIVWDLLPDWGEFSGKGCLHADRVEIAESLQNAGLGIEDERISLVCIHKMLEAWIIADERALTKFLSTDAHPVSVARKKKTEGIKDPKSALISLFKSSPSRISRYEDTIHAIKIVREMPNLARLQRLPSFQRFEEKLTK